MCKHLFCSAIFIICVQKAETLCVLSGRRLGDAGGRRKNHSHPTRVHKEPTHLAATVSIKYLLRAILHSRQKNTPRIPQRSSRPLLFAVLPGKALPFKSQEERTGKW